MCVLQTRASDPLRKPPHSTSGHLLPAARQPPACSELHIPFSGSSTTLGRQQPRLVRRDRVAMAAFKVALLLMALFSVLAACTEAANFMYLGARCISLHCMQCERVSFAIGDSMH